MPLIRDAREGDLPAIVAIYNDSIPTRQATADTEPITVDSRRDWFGRHSPQRYALWVCESGIEIVAWLSFSPAFSGRPAYASTAEISLYVSSNHRRQGLGQALLARAVDQSPTLGLETLLALVFAHNAASLSLFGKFQFRPWGYLPKIAKLDKVEGDLIILGRRVL
ncbi:MAG: N-acetyltransferase family protein [Anaerolineales bacterium]|jgi:phosphinothricin acetyltransferase